MSLERALFALAGAVVRVASVVVPADERSRWRQEWEAELTHRSSEGLGYGSALRLLRRSFGAVPHALWYLREAWRWDSFSQDFRSAARALAKRPGFVLAASVTLAVGIGASTLLFSIVDAVLLRPLPYPEPEQLVSLFEIQEDSNGARHGPAPANVLDWRRESRSFLGITAWWVTSATLLADARNEAEEVPTAQVTIDFFPVLSVAPLLGRPFDPREVESSERVALLSYELWRRRYAEDEAVVGSDVRLKDGTWQVIGVLPPGFRVPGTLPSEIHLFKPWDFERDYAHHGMVPRDWRFLEAGARLAPGVSLEEARSEMEAIAASLANAHPITNRGWTVALVPLAEAMVGHVETALFVLAGAVLFILLLACSNVAGLLLVRAAARGRELAVRTALGASRGRLVRQLLLESSLLAALGGALGALLAWGGVQVLARFPPAGIYRLEETVLDGRVLAFAVGISVLAGLASGLAPAFQSSTAAPSESLKGTAGSVSLDRRRSRLRTTIVVFEVAAAILLVTGSALFLRSLSRIVAVDPGFDPHGLLVARMRLDVEEYGKGRAHLYYTELVERLRALPGVLAAGGVPALPMDPVDVDFDRPFWRDGEPRPPGGGPGVRVRIPVLGYFETMRIPLLEGRLLDDRDDRERPRVILVNETMAQRTWPGESPVGKRIRLDYQNYDLAYEVVGVVGDTRFDGFRSGPAPEIYIPHAQNPYLPMNLVVRGRSEASLLDLAPLLRRAALELDPDQPVHSIELMRDLAGAHLGRDRFTAFVMTAFGAVALLLSTIGLYGVVAQSVSQRKREMGLRMALGADRTRIAALVLGSGLRIAASGALLGLIGAFVAGRFLESVLFEISPADPLSLGLALALSTTTVLLACALPAKRAARLDPRTTLQID